jgi:hypothetical protein
MDHFENIVINIFNNIKPNIQIDEFLTLLTNKSKNTVSWKKKEFDEKTLYMFFHEWNTKNILPNSNLLDQNYIVKYFNNLIMDSDFNIIMYNVPKIYDSVRDNISMDQIMTFIENKLDQITVFEANEGTSINIFYYIDQWFFTTKRTFDMNESIYGSTNSHGLMFENIIKRDELIPMLNNTYTYHLTLIHKDNSHLSIIENNRLILNNVRNTKDNFNIIDIDLINQHITRPILTTIDTIRSQDLNKQGIIIHYMNFIFRIYNDLYAESLKNKPHYGTIQEKYMHQYQKNEFTTDNEIKLCTMTSFNFVAIILHRILMHFTIFTTEDPKVKFKHINQEDYHLIKSHNVIIRNLNKLQHIPFVIKTKTTVDFNQVKFHLKKHSNYRDIYMMFKIFYEKDNELLKCINYSTPKNIQYKDHINTNIETFANLKF